MKHLGEVMRGAGWWLDSVERGSRGCVDLLFHRMVDLIAAVANRENVGPDEARELLRRGYLFRAIENAIDNNITEEIQRHARS